MEVSASPLPARLAAGTAGLRRPIMNLSGGHLFATVALAVLLRVAPAFGECLYIANTEAQSVSVVSTASLEETRTVSPAPVSSCPIDGPPIRFAIEEALADPVSKRLLLASSSCSLLAVDQFSDQVSAVLKFGTAGGRLRAVLDVAFRSLYVLDSTTGILASIDLATFSVRELLLLGDYFASLALDSTGRRLFVGGREIKIVSLNTMTVTSAIPLAHGADALAYLREPQRLFVSVRGTPEVPPYILSLDPENGDTVARHSHSAPLPVSVLEVDPEGRFVYAAGAGESTIRAHERESLSETFVIDLPGEPGDMAISRSGEVAYVTLPFLDQVVFVSLIDGEIVRTEELDCGLNRCRPSRMTLGACPSTCIGDCDGSADVTVDEITTAVQSALGDRDALSRCAAVDIDLDLAVSIDEIILAIQAALVGCNR